MNHRKTVLSVWAALALVLLFAACQGKGEAAHPVEPVSVEVQMVESRIMKTQLTYSGTVEASASIGLSFSIPGEVERVRVKAGQRVARGEVLAELNEIHVKSAYEMARAKLEQAEDALKRFKPMHSNTTLPDIKMVEIETAVREARAAALMAQKNLSDCRLVAPIAGIIGRRSLEAGMNVVPGVEILTLLEDKALMVKFPVPENEIAKMQMGMKAEVVIPALSSQNLEAELTELGVVANIMSRSYEVKALIKDPPQTVRSGMVCRVSVDRFSPNPVLMVRRPALQRDDAGQAFVYVVEAEGRARRRSVVLGTLGDEGVVILEGLKAGEQVVTSGTQKLNEGSIVRVI